MDFFPASATLPFQLFSSESIFLIKPTLEVRTSIFTISHDLIMKLVQILSDSFKSSTLFFQSLFNQLRRLQGDAELADIFGARFLHFLNGTEMF